MHQSDILLRYRRLLYKRRLRGILGSVVGGINTLVLQPKAPASSTFTSRSQPSTQFFATIGHKRGSISVTMAFTVLSDTDVKSLLANLTTQDLKSISSALQRAFVAYSLENEGQYQPHRASVTRPNGQSALFMPATTPSSLGAKIIGVPPADAKGKEIRGAIVLCDQDGKATGILNASEITAFRTALGSMVIFEGRKKVGKVVVFGAGKQALWHVKLALLLRQKDIKRITIINRTKERSEEMIKELKQEGRLSEGTEVEAFDSGRLDHDEVLKKSVQEADVIFATTPSKMPLFPASYMEEAFISGRGPYISTIGSYKPDMSEMDPQLFRNLVTSRSGYNPRGEAGGVIVVDTKEGCFVEAGEIIQGKIEAGQIIEVGEVLDLRGGQAQQNHRLGEWLEDGLIVYKSVGMGIMDLAVSNRFIELAREKEIGTTLTEF
jgi:ornithine cyclodeaminase/alanine dehydrogenase-like protein (mu-crystallin family)